MSQKQIQILAVSGISLLIVGVLLYSSVYIVDPTEKIIVTQFGDPVKTVEKEGLHFKIPFVHTVNRFDKRILEWDGESSSILTLDQRVIQVDTFARWRIADPLLFFQSLGDERRADSRLNDFLHSETKTEVARNNLVEIIRTTKGRETNPDIDAELIADLEPVQVGRGVIEDAILAAASEKVKELGIELLEIRFKRINYKERKVVEQIWERMSSERREFAEQLRSEGKGEADKIRGSMDKEMKRISSEAYKLVQETQGQADSKATSIYAAAFNKSPEAVEFYQFMKTMEVYKTILKGDSTVVLSTDSDLFEFFKGIDPELRNPVDWGDAALHPDKEQLPLFLRDN
ncbi:MAG: membrane protease subunit HflC [Verrucomicrobiales bacterium]|jgi:membrane protease subunit HflC